MNEKQRIDILGDAYETRKPSLNKKQVNAIFGNVYET